MTKATASAPRVLYWFRTDLRLHDSPALTAALDLKPSVLYCCWTWDPHYVYRARVGPNRWQFLLDCQNDLSASLTKLNPKQKLLVIREAPQTVLPRLFKDWKITHLVFEKDTDAYARERDEAVMKQAKEMGVEVVVKTGRTLYDPDDLVKANGGRPTMSISQVQSAAKSLPEIPRPLPAPTSLPDPGPFTLSFTHSPPDPTPDFNSIDRSNPDKSYTSLSGPSHSFAPPTLSELGIKPATTPHRGGETLALASLASITSNATYTATFSKPETAPTAFDPRSTTLLSPHHHFGSLSVRTVYWAAQDAVDLAKKEKRPYTSPPTSLTGQLLFRDMYFGAQAALGYSFAQTYNNKTARFIPWHLPSRISPATELITGSYDVDDSKAHECFLRWKYGRTGFPWIDALMRQLRLEGWIHHLGRHAVACFLTRGGCYVDWERGAEVFEEWLIDHETACNVGNWQWLACVAFYSQFYRCYSPIAFPSKWDKHGEFIRHYVPELSNYSDKYIYEPWKAPIKDQKDWGCVIKGDGGWAESNFARNPGDHTDAQPSDIENDTLSSLHTAQHGATLPESDSGDGAMKVYPKPMFDFPTQREICINGLKQAYHIGLFGNDPKVKDGTWRDLFGDDAEGPTEGTEGPVGAMLGDGAGEEEGARVDGAEKVSRKRRNGQKGGIAGAFANASAAGRKHKREEDEDGIEEGEAGRARTSEAQSPKVARTNTHARKGSKSGGQATLDGMVKRSKK